MVRHNQRVTREIKRRVQSDKRGKTLLQTVRSSVTPEYFAEVAGAAKELFEHLHNIAREVAFQTAKSFSVSNQLLLKANGGKGGNGGRGENGQAGGPGRPGRHATKYRAGEPRDNHHSQGHRSN